MKSLILGSNSPRRKELLTQLGFDFTVRTNEIDEIVPDGMPPAQAAEYLAILKNKVIDRAAHEIVLTADTVVIQSDTILGKPKDALEATNMLRSLSNGQHEVITGVSISSQQQVISFSCRTLVTFNALSAAEIAHYIHTCNPTDKAGGYGIQEWIGLAHIKSIEGSFYNVVGLPTDKVYQVLTTNFQLEAFKHGN